MAHTTVARPGSATEIVRDSRFLGFADSVSSAAEALELIESLRQTHPDASHHCWAYRVDTEMRFSDDGEPGGTAGRPMLEVVLKRDLDRVAVVVVRYFGGTRLGAGGLVRAYGGTAAKALDLAGKRLVEDRVELTVHVPFPALDVVHRLFAETRGALAGAGEFDVAGCRFDLELPAEEADGFRERLAEITRGAATCEFKTG
ncbi:MAG: YigZ family protein [Trueperaceae bacterium]